MFRGGASGRLVGLFKACSELEQLALEFRVIHSLGKDTHALMMGAGFRKSLPLSLTGFL
jgi:hypothetical protein